MTKMIFLVFALVLTGTAWGKTVYIKATATGLKNGTSWANAYTNLQSAIAAAASGDEIWVAAGTYKPTSIADRTKSFAMKSGMKMYGGFKGTETLRSQRDWAANKTILSGDIGVQGNTADNSYHVVTGASRVALDGFTITGGASTDRLGGGVFGDRVTSLTVTHCNFSGNSAARGGGIYTTGSTTVVSYCAFTGNSAGSGGGIFCDEDSLTLSQCTFTANTAKYNGGGFSTNYYYKPLPIRVWVSDCSFSGNKVTTFESLGGGGMYIANGSTRKCDFLGNNSKSNGGGLYFEGGEVISCTFSKNSASWFGGGISNRGGDVINCVVSGNTAQNGGGGIECPGAGELVHCTIVGNTGDGIWGGGKVSNCIVYGNSTSEVGGMLGMYIFTCCNVRNWNTTMGRDGGGNISAAPLFMNESNPAGPDGVWRTGDDGLRLQPVSSCINAGLTSYAPATDILGNRRVGPADMGAYECQSPTVKNSTRGWMLYR